MVKLDELIIHLVDGSDYRNLQENLKTQQAEGGEGVSSTSMTRCRFHFSRSRQTTDDRRLGLASAGESGERPMPHMGSERDK